MNKDIHYLIIIRGVPAVGKSRVATLLVERLGRIEAKELNMDEVRGETLDNEIKDSLTFQYVIADIFFGGRNTKDPIWWISQFKERGFKPILFRLDVGKDTGWNRCLVRGQRSKEDSWLNYEEYNKLYDHFYNDPVFTNFPERAEIEEALIDTENKSYEEIRDEILKIIEQQ